MGYSKTVRYHRALTILFVAMVLYVPILNPFVPVTSFGRGIPDIDIERVVFVILFCFSIWSYLQYKSMRVSSSWIAWISALTVLVFLSPSWSDFYSVDSAFVQRIVIDMIMPLLVACLAIPLFQNDRAVTLYAKNACIVVSLLSVMAIFQFVFKSSLSESGEVRSAAMLGNANLLAIVLVMLQPVILYATETKKLNRVIGYIAVGLLTVAVLTTVSRKGIACCFLVYLMFFFLSKRYKQLVISFCFAALVGAIAFSFSEVSQRFSADEIDRNVQGKKVMTEAGIGLFMEKPLLGHGYKGYYEYFNQLFYTIDIDRKYDAHNEYITTLTNFGIVGFLLFLMIFIYPVILYFKIFGRSAKHLPQEYRMRALIGISSITTFALCQFYAGTIFYHTGSAVSILYANVGMLIGTVIHLKKARKLEATVE